MRDLFPCWSILGGIVPDKHGRIEEVATLNSLGLMAYMPNDDSLSERSSQEGHSMPSKTEVFIEAPSTLAVIVLSNEPLLFLSEDLRIIAASISFCGAFDIDPATIVGRRLSEIGSGEWAMPKLASLLNATAAGSANIEAYEISLTRKNLKTRQLVLNAQILADGEKDHIRLLLAVTDVTDARAAARQKDELLIEKAILIQEVQHRVANSLQIIASVLMQSARRVQSEEARGHLHNAHHRVMSIAAVQKQLSTTQGGKVPLRAYLILLCESLGASMIADENRISIAVNVDDSSVDADVSVSLGLIVTELVINSLKHAFPDQPKGRITVGFVSEGRDWTLSITDDGIGMSVGPAAPKAGLGTGIVEALAKNLQSDLTTSNAEPGTVVTIRHRARAEDLGAVPSAA